MRFIVLSFSWLGGQDVKISESKAAKNEAQRYRGKSVQNGVFHGVAFSCGLALCCPALNYRVMHIKNT